MVFIHGAFSAVLYVFLFLVLLPSFVASSESSTATTSTRELLFFGWKEDTCGAKWWWSGAAASCVCSAEELRQRIALAASTDAVENSVIVNPTQISLCHNSHIVLDSEIDLTDKAIALQCGTTSAIFGSLGGLLRSSCIVDGNHRTRLFSGSNAQVSLHGITFINGFVPAPTSWPTEYMDRGGAAIKLKDSIVTMDRCEFSNHDTPTGPGGAIAVQGGSIRVSSSTLTENSAMVGGALAALDARVHTVQTRFWANRAREGGASSFQGGSVILEKTVVFQNSATAGYGGALLLVETAVDMIRSTFSGNLATSVKGKELEKGFDIYVNDDIDPNLGGTLLVCDNSVFCQGRKGMLEAGNVHDNIDCDTSKDVFGYPGLFRCPLL